MTDLESSDDDISEIQAEIAHLSAISSEHVTRYYGSFVRGYRLWIVMEYLAGGSCLDLVRASIFRYTDSSSNRGHLMSLRLPLSVASCCLVSRTYTEKARFTGTSKRPMSYSVPRALSSSVSRMAENADV